MNARFEKLQDEHRTELGVTWHLSEMHGAGHIMGLRNRGAKGNGALALRDICDLADEVGAVLMLGCSIEKLKPWYQGFGFRPIRDFRQGTYCATFFRRLPA